MAATDSTAENLDRARVLCGGIFWDHDMAGDIASEDFCKALVFDVGKRVGDIGLLVNNAAIPGRGSLDEITEEAALSIFRVNVLAPLWLTRACRGSLLRRRGSVINISSAQTQAFCEKTHLYVASKAALEQLTRYMASEFLGSGVRVNAIRVGRVPGAAFLRKWTDTLPPEAARELIEKVMFVGQEVPVATNQSHVTPLFPQGIGCAVRFGQPEREARSKNVFRFGSENPRKPVDGDQAPVPPEESLMRKAGKWGTGTGALVFPIGRPVAASRIIRFSSIKRL